jgi:hypothetical protein
MKARANEDAAGYSHRLYVESLAEWGVPVALRQCEGWLLRREIPATSYRDAMSPYPFLACRSWSALCDDIAALDRALVSVTVVTDPFGDASGLAACFDVVRTFKEHHVADSSVPMNERVWRHHRRQARRGMRTHVVEVLDRPLEHLDEWTVLYDNVISRYALSGLKAFSRSAFEHQLQVPGMVAFRARRGSETTAMALWYEQGDVAYRHLAASSALGYAESAMHALDWHASEWFTGRCAWLHFGSVAGSRDGPGSGLDVYKRGWSTTTIPNYLCTVVLDRETYRTLSATLRPSPADYFPAYRAGELL